MSNIDYSRMHTAKDKAAQALEARTAAVKDECKRRILAVADIPTQLNIGFREDELSADDLAVWKAAKAWVLSMQAACVPLIADPKANHTADAAWPDVPAGAAELAAKFRGAGMTFREALDSGMQSIVSWLAVGALGGVWWLIRRIFTNLKQIETLQSALQSRDEQRKRDLDEFRGSFKRIEDAQKEMRDDIKNLFQR